MNDSSKQADQQAQELDEQALDQASAGKASNPPEPSKGSNVTGMDDWEKHNV